MKICGIICEYNPFHNGHAYLIERAKKESGCDAVVCVMSGNFTQRGEIALLGKYTRARHALLAGADAVLELPAVFALSPAEIFARGAVKILSSIPAFEALAFGCETDSKTLLHEAARITAAESEQHRAALRGQLRAGVSLTRARTEALMQTGRADLAAFLRSPNNILGTEYKKSLDFYECRANILPILRKGVAHTDALPRGNIASASAIRAAVRSGQQESIAPCVPSYVLNDLQYFADDAIFKKFAHLTALTADADMLSRIIDCTEGLENRIKSCAREADGFDSLIGAVTTKRYISSRIRRILASAVLGIGASLVRAALEEPLYLKILALRKSRAEELLREFGRSKFPILARQNEIKSLKGAAAEAYRKDLLAGHVYRLCCKAPEKEQLLPVMGDDKL